MVSSAGEMRSFINELLRTASSLLLDLWSHPREVAFKVRHSDLVTDADRILEDAIVRTIRSAHPYDGILSEESGYYPGTSGTVWVVDPLDGTANFASGIPDFGTIVGLVRDGEPWMGGFCLPAYQMTYLAERGRGAARNGRAITVSRDTDLKNVLIDYSFHFRDDPSRIERQNRIFRIVWPAVRGIRSTGSLRYLAQCAEGQIGAFIAHELSLWDIVGPAVVLEEAGAILSDLRGDRLDFQIHESNSNRTMQTVGANPALHAQLIALIKQVDTPTMQN